MAKAKAKTKKAITPAVERKVKRKLSGYLKAKKRIQEIKESPLMTEMDNQDETRKKLKGELADITLEYAQEVVDGKNGDKVHYLTVGKRKLVTTTGTKNGYIVSQKPKKDFKVVDISK